jgi:hypothetical protein
VYSPSPQNVKKFIQWPDSDLMGQSQAEAGGIADQSVELFNLFDFFR